jgi:2-keto-4-pentenoate hydratase/2-oxohepta-3-ene-1,7-dioic acid hydratase in catechol pathway
MKLCTFMAENTVCLGVKTDQGIVDVAAAVKEASSPPEQLPTTMMEVIAGGSQAVAALERFLGQLELSVDQSYVLSEDNVTWGPTVTRPEKIICVGLNYRRQADETNSPYPETPILFNKFNNTLTCHFHYIAVPEVTEALDYEVELGIVIGKTAKHVAREDALDYVFGYCAANDLSARDLQMRTPQWLLGKSCDDFSPVGPYLVTADEVGDPQQLYLKTIVNGEVRQDSHTSDMIFTCEEIVSYISKHMTLRPGDLILTGTPEGVVLGYPEDKRVYLRPGDVVSVEIENLGTLTNRFGSGPVSDQPPPRTYSFPFTACAASAASSGVAEPATPPERPGTAPRAASPIPGRWPV